MIRSEANEKELGIVTAGTIGIPKYSQRAIQNGKKKWYRNGSPAKNGDIMGILLPQDMERIIPTMCPKSKTALPATNNCPSGLPRNDFPIIQKLNAKLKMTRNISDSDRFFPDIDCGKTGIFLKKINNIKHSMSVAIVPQRMGSLDHTDNRHEKRYVRGILTPTPIRYAAVNRNTIGESFINF